MRLMNLALVESIRIAEQSLNSGGFPVGSIICIDGSEISRGASSTEIFNDVTAHAEVQAIRAAAFQSRGGILYSSLEPCMMCLAACAWAGIRQVVFACARSAVNPAYYESNMAAEEVSRLLVPAIEVVSALELQNEVIALIRRWEEIHSSE